VQSAVEFFGWIFQRCETGNINLRFIGDKVKSEFLPLPFLFDNPHKVSPILDQHKAFNSYFAVALRNGNNGKKEAITQVPALWVDMDGSPLQKVQEAPWKPSAIIETSPGKFHVYWKLREPADKTEIGKVEGLLKRLACFFAGDQAATDASHILRIPGTLNHKTTPPFSVSLRSMEEIEYNLSDFDDLPEVEQAPQDGNPAFSSGDRLKKIMECRFLQHCDKDRASLPEPEWYAMINILARESGGRDLIHSLSRGYAKYSTKETDEKILHALNAGPLTCQKIKSLWKCGQICGVVSPVRLAQKRTETAPAASAGFPREMIGGLAGEFADLYSHYLESPWSFFAFGFLTCLGHLIGDRVTLASEISPQPRLYTVCLGESADDRKSESIKRTIKFFEGALTQGSLKLCHGVGSSEGLAKILDEGESPTKKLLLVYDELKAFVGKACIEGSTLLPAVATLFESNRFHSATKKEILRLEDVYLSLLGASTVETYSGMWTPAFLDIGMLNRFWVVKDHGERRYSVPREIPSGETKGLYRRLGDILGAASSSDGPLKLSLTEEAFEIFDNWYLNQGPSIFARRLDTYGHRLMILLAINEGLQEVTGAIAEKAVSLLRWEHDIRRECDPVEAETNIAKMEEMIRRKLAGGPMEQRELQRRVHYNRYGLFVWRTAVENLLRAKEIFFDRKPKVYSLC
jgi:hypothetical protein